ncbi:unnamed protein product [Schistosoma turkestanicum]|nr:unnamed protein product [Schistosoma turkestanicum]
MAAEIATPLIAFGCALVVFLLFVISLVSYHVICGHRKKPTTLPQLPANDSPCYPDNSPSVHFKLDSLQHTPEDTPTNMNEPSTSRSGFDVLLQSRLEIAEIDDENEYCKVSKESPLEYAYEGPDDEPLQQTVLGSETNSNKIESPEMSPTNHHPPPDLK